MDKDNRIQKRREERQQALNFLFERMFRDDTIEDLYNDALDSRDEEVSDYAKKVVEGIESNLDEIDGLIQSHLKGWKINRISKIALSVMRIAVYEMKYVKSVPISVSINEAVNLAKKYGDDRSYAFINSVLGKISRNI